MSIVLQQNYVFVCVLGVFLGGMAVSRHRDYILMETVVPRRSTRTGGARRTRRVVIFEVNLIIFHFLHFHVLTMCKSPNLDIFPRLGRVLRLMEAKFLTSVIGR